MHGDTFLVDPCTQSLQAPYTEWSQSGAFELQYCTCVRKMYDILITRIRIRLRILGLALALAHPLFFLGSVPVAVPPPAGADVLNSFIMRVLSRCKADAELDGPMAVGPTAEAAPLVGG